MSSKLGLGTAQFGLDYSIANPSGRVPESEVASILDVARVAGVTVLDTAPAYGHAQAVLGRLLRKDDHFRIITKTAAVPTSVIGDKEIAAVQAAFDASLAALGAEHVAGVLVHQANDLLKPGGDRLFARLQEWQAQGRAGKIGVSVYDRQQIVALLERYPIELVQLPLNVFDQRLIRDGTLTTLARAGVEIHARSIFLQGLLFMEETTLPPFVSFWRDAIRAFHTDVERQGVAPLAAALAFVCQRPEIDVGLIGVLSASQLRQCLEAVRTPISLDWARYAIDDPKLVDPRCWPVNR